MRFCIMGIVVALAVGPPVLAATPIALHLGQNNPVTDEGWFINSSGGTGAPGSEGGVDYWETNTTGSQRQSYQFDLTSGVDNSSPWEFGATLKVVAHDLPLGNIRMTLYDNLDRWDFVFTETEIAWKTESGFTTSPISFNTTDDYHTYKIVYDPSGDGGNGSGDLFIDDAFQQTFVRSDIQDGTGTFVRFGDNSGSSSGTTTARWSEVYFPAPIPEPATLQLLLMGLAGAMLIWRRQRA